MKETFRYSIVPAIALTTHTLNNTMHGEPNFSISQITAIIGLLGSCFVFYRYASKVSREQLSLEGFVLSNRNVDAKKFSNTFASSSLSLASVIIFFISMHEHFGLFILLDTSSYIFGQILFLYLAKKISVDFRKNGNTVSDLIYSVVPSKAVARLISLIMVTSYIAIVFIELYIGSVILSLFLPKGPVTQTLSFAFLGLLVVGYVRLGGYKAIIQTDSWQFWLIMFSSLAILVFALIVPATKEVILEQTMLTRFFSFNESWGALAIFVPWMLLINIALPFAQLSNWQRIAASTSIQTAWIGIKNAIWKVIVVFLVPATCFIVIRAKGYSYADLPQFLDLVHNLSGGLSIILYPAIILGFAATLFSTADTSIIAIFYALSDKNTFGPYLQRVQSLGREHILRRNLTWATLILIALLCVFYWVQIANLANWFLPMIFTLFGQIAILVPLVLYAFYRISKQSYLVNLTNMHYLTLFNGIILGWLIVLVGAGISFVTGHEIWSMMALPVGMFAVLCALTPLIKSVKVKSSNPIPLDDDEELFHH